MQDTRSNSASAATQQRPTVFFDGSCPVCSREIALYRGMDGAGCIDWVDVSAGKGEIAPGFDRESAMARFHMRRADGKIVSGAAAFAELWASVPRLRLAGRIARLPPFVWVLEIGYRVFLRLRPLLHKIVRRG
jgi:predicted DCC family thiol-disulfide oxidoreductase YuxK